MNSPEDEPSFTGLRILKFVFLLCSLLSFLALAPGMHLVNLSRYGITVNVTHQRFGWLLSVVYGLVFAAEFYGLHRRLRIAWKFGWVLLAFFCSQTIVLSLISTLKEPPPSRWAASAFIVVGNAIVGVYCGLWWKRQKSYFVDKA